MSADLAAARVFPGNLFNLHIDCERIDFDFFDDASSAASSWRSSAANGRAEDAAEGGRGGNAPSPMLTSGPTPAESTAASATSLRSTAAPGDVVRDSHHSPARTEEDVEPVDEDEQGVVEDLDEDLGDDVVVGVVDSDSLGPGGDGVDGTEASAVVPEGAEAHDIVGVAHGDGVEEDGDRHSDEDDEEAEAASFAIQELTLTVTNRKTRAVSSITAMSAVSDASRGDSDDVEDTIEAIAHALRRAHRPSRPSSSTASLPAPGPPCRPPPRAPPRGPPRPSRRLNMSFSNDEARRIQRDNELLLRRIVCQRARPPRLAAPAPAAAPAGAPPTGRHCSHAVNRARRVRDIERENQILLKKIQTVKRSPSQLSVLSRSASAMSGRFSCG